MKFGLMQLFTWPSGKPVEEVYEDALRQAQHAEALGFDSIWLAEHHFSEYGILGQPMILAASIVQRTKRIRIGTAVMVLPFHHPIRLAEDAAVVDILSRGRLDVGVGRGYQPIEFAGLNVPQDEARARFEESLEIMKQAWTTERLSYDGQFYQIKNLAVLPRPSQKPHPPLWIAAVSNETYERAGRMGYPVLSSPNFTPVELVKRNYQTYREALRGSGHDPSQFDTPMMQQVYVADSMDAARREPEQYTMRYFQLLGSLVPGGHGETVPDEYKFYGKLTSNIRNLDYDYLFEEGVTFGDPPRIVERLQRLQAEIGIDHFICWFNFGGLPTPLVERSMERFAREVMPAFKPAPVPV